MRARVNDSASALLRAVQAQLPAETVFVLEEIRSRSWASATFSGARHELAFRIEGDGAEAAAERFLATLDIAEFALRGHILADVALVSQARRAGCAEIRLEALTVDDA